MTIICSRAYSFIQEMRNNFDIFTQSSAPRSPYRLVRLAFRENPIVLPHLSIFVS
jgi:hypothetical protein